VGRGARDFSSELNPTAPQRHPTTSIDPIKYKRGLVCYIENQLLLNNREDLDGSNKIVENEKLSQIGILFFQCLETSDGQCNKSNAHNQQMILNMQMPHVFPCAWIDGIIFPLMVKNDFGKGY
jgi:hypothetical protein